MERVPPSEAPAVSPFKDGLFQFPKAPVKKQAVKRHYHKHNLRHRYEFLETLGKGTYGKVKKARERSGKLVRRSAAGFLIPTCSHLLGYPPGFPVRGWGCRGGGRAAGREDGGSLRSQPSFILCARLEKATGFMGQRYIGVRLMGRQLEIETPK